jgi:TrkA-N domain
VVVIATDANQVTLPPQENLQVSTRSAIEPEALAAVGIDGLGTFLALTENTNVNAVIAQQAAEEFAPPRVVAAFPSETTTSSGVKQAFSANFEYETWLSHLRDGAVRLGMTVIQADEAQQVHLRSLTESGTLLPFAIQQVDKLSIVAMGTEFVAGDQLIYLFYDPKPQLLKRLSGSSQPLVSVETIAEVETIPLLEPIVEESLLPMIETTLKKSVDP